MQTIQHHICHGTYPASGARGSEDPTRAALAFLFAKGAVEEGHRPEVILVGNAAVLARQTVADNVIRVGSAIAEVIEVVPRT